MAGRKQFDIDEALDRAMTVFWERGYSETSLDLIGAATNLGKGSLYATFGDKDELFRRSLDRYAETFGAQYELALSRHLNDPVAAIAAFFDVVLTRIGDPSLPGGCLIALAAASAPTLSAASRAKVSQLLDRQKQRIRMTLPQPNETSARYDDLATFVVATNQALAVMDRAGSSAPQLRSIAQTAVSAIKSQMLATT